MKRGCRLWHGGAPPRRVPIRFNYRQRFHRDGQPLEVDPGPHPAWSGVRRRRAVLGGDRAGPTVRVVRLWAGRGVLLPHVGRWSAGLLVHVPSAGTLCCLRTEYGIRLGVILYWGFSSSVGRSIIHERGDRHLRRRGGDDQCRRRLPPPGFEIIMNWSN
ncbi:hypothetical protein B296_00056051 [Ensete ventricosum]|uniref:Uncharacterized protein n=1 Tax=Ensete ventricosum TaxID=4639 RepID=A0A426XWT4_ENSVE|nr:hypothetical protein B296_00056051 [Ensete ventricosum]